MDSFVRYVLGRILYALPTFLVIITLVFVLIHSAPGDPVAILMGESGSESPALRQAIIISYGLDKPLYVQYFIYLAKVVQGNFGYSTFYSLPVIQIVLGRLQNTLILGISSVVVVSLLGVTLGVTAAMKENSFTDRALTVGSTIFYSVPSYWLGILLLFVGAVWLRAFPASGIISAGADYTGLAYLGDLLRHLALPLTAAVLSQIAILFKISRASFLEMKKQDFVTTAYSKGLPERVVVIKHILRNSLLPIVTIVGADIGFIVTGVVFSEIVFSWPGLGRLMTDSIATRDYPTIMASFILISLSVIVAAILTDILYAVLDPRVKLGKGYKKV